MIVAGTLLMLASPILAIIALTVRLVDGSPVFFRQTRSGTGGQPFVMRKFRTMNTDSEDPRTDGERITRLGRILRLSSLDELPTLASVVTGEMSLVGPRPLPVRYLGRYSASQRRRLDVQPGITGLAQVSGRNDLTWEERFELDVEYVDSQSFGKDVLILARTLRSVVLGRGVEAGSSPTMPEFGIQDTADEGNDGGVDR